MAEQPLSKVEKDLLPTANTPGEQDNAAADEPVLAWEGDTFDLPAVAGAGLPAEPPLTEVQQPSSDQGRAQEALAADNHSSSPRGGDESPTIISRMPVRGLALNDARGTSLRGRRLAHFELIAPIGVGGMAAVIKGRDLQLDRTVALKVLPPDMAADPENIRRFHQEARAAAKLDHENIARVFFCGEDQKLHFIAFEFVQGDNLRIILDRRGRLPVGEALNYILQVATGLAHAASRGVVHRDIKPSNIIITPTGRAKLVDMGLARSMAPQDDRGLTQSGVTLGTFDYISPEQALEPREADVRSDIYSLGCTFYHMLTGQPPVPEGTAAKKLHCHQHELPVDPRQFNPDIPDEVAAILARMMAKQVRDRYQRPEHLVQHLLRAAQKLDASGGHADGVLFVDAPLPAAPARPLFLAALAVAAVIVLVFVLQQSMPNGPGPRPFTPAAIAAARDKTLPREVPPKSARPNKEGQPTPPSAPPSDTTRGRFVFDGNVAALAQFLDSEESRKPVIELTIAENLVIGSFSSVPGGIKEALKKGIALKGRRIVIKGKAREGQSLPTIWLAYGGESDRTRIKTALTLEAQEVVLEGLRIVLQGNTKLAMTAVHLLGGSAHEIRNCEFVQVNPSDTPDKPLCSVRLEGSRNPDVRPSLRLSGCAFVGGDGREEDRLVLQKIVRGGQDALTRWGEAHVTAENCVFGPHQSCFHLEGTSTRSQKDVELDHCSVLLGEGSTVFHLGPAVLCQLRVNYCLFAGPEAKVSEKAALLRQDAGGMPLNQALQFVGYDNRYRNLNASGDSFAAVLETSPWAADDPLTSLRHLRFAEAFRVRPNAPELRLTGLDRNLIGAERFGNTDYTNGLPSVQGQKVPAVGRRVKIVDPLLRGFEDGTFRTLSQALEEVQPGDVVLIRHNGLLRVKPIRFDGSVTIKPASGCRPVLTLDTTKTTEGEVELIRVSGGKVQFEQLEFRLDPGSEGFNVQAVATLLGEGSCSFEGCVITLAEPRRCQLAAVLVEPGSRRGTEKKGVVPSVLFKRCLVRGNGDLVWCRSSRPFRLEAVNTLVALSGSALAVDAARGDEPEGAKAILDFRRVTVVVGGHLLRLRPANKDLKGIVPLTCNPADCLFASLGSKALVHVDGGEADETALKDKLIWKGSKNAYNVPFLVDQLPTGVGMMRTTFDREKWKTFTGETDGKFLESIKFAETPDADGLADANPEQFAVSDLDLKGFGADVGQLPVPQKAPADKRRMMNDE